PRALHSFPTRRSSDLREGYLGALFLGLTLLDPWMKEFPRSHTPAVLYDNLIMGNPTVATLGIDNNEAIGQAMDALYGMGHRKIRSEEHTSELQSRFDL